MDEMKLQDGRPHLKALHRNPLKDLVASLVLGAHCEIELRADCSLSVFSCFILLLPLNQDFPLQEDMFGKT